MNGWKDTKGYEIITGESVGKRRRLDPNIKAELLATKLAVIKMKDPLDLLKPTR